MAYKDAEVGKERGRERSRRRVAKRLAAGFCTRCGREPPETGRKTCEACAERKRIADRQRDARLRCAGLPRRDPNRARAYERGRSRRVVEERAERALCTKCGVNPPRTGGAGANPAWSSAGRTTASVTRRPPHPGSCTAAGIRRRKGGTPAPPAGSAGRTAWPPASARVAAEIPPSRAPPRASLAGSRGARRNAKPMPPGDPPGSASGAVVRRPTGHRGARPVRCWKASAETRNAGTRRAGRDTGPGARNRAARTAMRPARGRRGARNAPGGVMRIPIISAGCRSTPRPSQWSFSAPDEPLGVFGDEMEVAAFLAFEKLARDRVEVLVDRSPLEALIAWE